jgi:hypothetical protein
MSHGRASASAANSLRTHLTHRFAGSNGPEVVLYAALNGIGESQR